MSKVQSPKSRTRRFWLAASAAFVLAGTLPARASQVTERWGASSTAEYAASPRNISVLDNYPTYNDQSQLLFGENNGAHKWALIYFSTANLPTNTVVHSARLKLSVYSYSEQLDGSEPVRQITDPNGLGLWSQTEATFGNRQSGLKWSLSGNGDLNTALGRELDSSYMYYVPQWHSLWLEWDVTMAVKDWVASPASNQGLALPYIANALYKTARHDDADASIRPILEITYEGTNSNRPPQPENVSAAHRSGQTFITWEEIASSSPEISYRVYRHTAAITSGNIGQATLLAEVPTNSGYYKREAEMCDGGSDCSPIGQTRFVIEDDGMPLPAGTGLFVYTVQNQNAANYHYAVTSVVEGNENRDDFGGSTAGPISEIKTTPRPVRVWTSSTNNGWVYTQFMDYHNWNSSFEGYAYNFYVGVPSGYSATGAPVGVAMQLHAWGGSYGSFWGGGNGSSYWYGGVLITPDDRTKTWWFGFNEHTGNREKRFADGRVIDYTHQRLDAILDFVLNELNVDPNRVQLHGGSMGGSGSVNYGLRRGDRFSAVYSESAMTDFATSGEAGGTDWVGDVIDTWGTPAQDLPTNLGVTIWDWYNLQNWVQQDPAAELPWLSDHHGKADDVIDWDTQGVQWSPALETGRRPFAAEFDNTDHGCACIRAVSPDVDIFGVTFRRNESIPAMTNASSSQDPATQYGCRNCAIEWSASWHNFAGAPVDTATRYEMVFRTTGGTSTVNITPRRLQSFIVQAGASYQWTNQPVGGGSESSGVVVADADALIMVPVFSVSATGNRLVLVPMSGSLPAPNVTKIEPATGPTTGGTAVTITGTNFLVGASVTIGGAAATDVQVVNKTSMTAKTGAVSTAGVGDVVVTNPDAKSGTLAGGFTYTSAPAGVRGDANGDSAVTVSDVFFLINYLFASGTAPSTSCGGDANGDGSATVSDVFFLINYLFAGGAAPGAC